MKTWCTLEKAKQLLFAVGLGLWLIILIFISLSQPDLMVYLVNINITVILLGLALLAYKVLAKPWHYAVTTATILALTLQFTLPFLPHPLAPVAQAASFEVDRVDDDASATACTGAANDCSLRGAIIAANATAAVDTIILGLGTYTLTLAGANEDAAATGDLDILNPVEIIGSGSPTLPTTINGNSLDRVFHVISGTTGAINLSELVIINGSSSGDGGGIYNHASATINIDEVVISNNEVIGSAEDGGGIANDNGGTINITNSSIENNQVTNGSGASGGGIFNITDVGSTINLTNTNVTTNTAAGRGGGIYTAQPLNINGGIIAFNQAGSTGGGIDSNNQSMTILNNVTVQNNTSGSSGGGIYRTNSIGSVTINNSTIISNTASGSSDGGGIATGFQGIVTIKDSLITLNSADDGGGIANAESNGTINVFNTTISNNTAADSGGGIFNAAGTNATLNILTSTITANTSGNEGGGIYSSQATNIGNSTISGNTAANNGGGLASQFDTSAIVLNHVTIANNNAMSGRGGGLYRGNRSGQGGGMVNFANTLIANNTASSDSDCRDQGGGSTSPATLTSVGNNLIEDTSGCSGLVSSDITGLDPVLDTLANNGGDTETHALLLGSPAIDAANDAFCTLQLPEDQRGQTRIDQAGVGTSNICDIGAYEFPGVSVPNLTIEDSTLTEGSVVTTLAFTLTLDAPINTPVSVDYTTTDDSATTTDGDYTAKNGTIVFPANSQQQVIEVTIKGDTTPEFDESFFIDLSNANWATLTKSQAVGNILNDDFGIGINNISVTETNEGTVDATFTVTLIPASISSVNVDYATADNTATTADSDYTEKSGTITITPGSTTQTVTISVIGDTNVESDESFYVNLSNSTSAAIVDNQGEGTIINDDSQTLIYLPVLQKN